MKKIDIKKVYEDLDQYKDTIVKFGGWVKSVRCLKKFAFLTLTDGSSFKPAQVVLDGALEGFEECIKLLPGSSVVCEGKIIATPDAKQPFEMQCTKVEIICKTDETYPLQKKGSSFEFLREQAYLRGRTTTFGAVYKIRSEAVLAVHKFFEQEGFTHIHAPVLTTSDCEGGCELYRVSSQDIYSGKQLKPEDELLGKGVFLSPTGQLEGEALAMGLGKIYTLAPTFRAEDSRTPRPLTEFWHVEPEIAFYDLEDVMEISEQMIKFIVKYIMDKCPDELEFCDKFIEQGLIERLKRTVEQPFARVTYTEAIKILEKVKDQFEYPVAWGEDLHTEHEKYLTEQVFKKPVYLYGYPRDFKAFYMKDCEDGKTCLGSDLLVAGIGELCGLSERESDYEKLRSKIQEFGLKEKDYWWYLKLRQYGSVPHSGFGMGFDRLIMFLTGMKSIKDVIPFPRTPGSCEF